MNTNSKIERDAYEVIDAARGRRAVNICDELGIVSNETIFEIYEFSRYSNELSDKTRDYFFSTYRRYRAFENSINSLK
jgi:hypothetical protein